MTFNFQPIPHAAAAARIKELPTVEREIYSQLVPELRAAVFTVKGVKTAMEREAIRDFIAAVPEGGDTFEGAKKKIARILEVNGYNPKAARIHSENLLRHWTGIAYSAARYRVGIAQINLFPYWQYLSMADGRVRPTHAALDKLIFPAPGTGMKGEEFWLTHLPPWEWSCRCSWVMLSEFDMEQIMEEDKNLPETRRRVLTGELLDRALAGSLTREIRIREFQNGIPVKERWAPAIPYNIQRRGDWGWNPENIVPSEADLKKLLKPESFTELMQAAETWQVDDGQTVAAWIKGTPQARRPRIAPLWKPAPRRAANPAAKPAAKPEAMPRISVPEAMQRSGFKPADPATWERAEAMLNELRHHAPGARPAPLQGITGKLDADNEWTHRDVTAWVDDFFSFTPPDLAARFGEFSIRTIPAAMTPAEKKDHTGEWAGKHRTVRLYAGGPGMRTAAEAKRTLFHELAHALSDITGRDITAWLADIQRHFEARTAGEELKDGGLYRYLEDGWYDRYAGREGGGELMPAYMELLSSPWALRAALVRRDAPGIMETLDTVIRILRNPGKA